MSTYVQLYSLIELSLCVSVYDRKCYLCCGSITNWTWLFVSSVTVTTSSVTEWPSNDERTPVLFPLSLCSILPIWQVSIYTEASLICLVLTSIVLHIRYIDYTLVRFVRDLLHNSDAQLFSKNVLIWSLPVPFVSSSAYLY